MQERERQRELRRALRVAARKGRIEDANVSAAAAMSGGGGTVNDSGRELGAELRPGRAYIDRGCEGCSDGGVERVRYLLAVQAMRQPGAGAAGQTYPKPMTGPERRLPQPGRGEDSDEMLDKDEDAPARPVEQHFGADAPDAPLPPLTLCKGCGAALQGRQRGRGAAMRLRFTCNDCGIAFETEPHGSGYEEDAGVPPDGRRAVDHVQGQTASGLAESDTDRAGDGGMDGVGDGGCEDMWGKWGLAVQRLESRGMAVSRRRRMRVVVEAVAAGSVAAASGVQVSGRDLVCRNGSTKGPAGAWGFRHFVS